MEITIDQIRELHGHYVEASLGETSSGRFLRSIVTEGRMPRGRGISWLEELIAKGNPQSVSPLVAEIEDLILRSKRQDTIQILSDILNRVKAGWVLTDHKKSELERLRKQVVNDLPDLELTARQELLLFGLGVRKHRSSYNYWASRPVISSRLDCIFKRWGADLKISPDDWQFVRDNFKSAVDEFEGGKHPVGALRWSRGSLAAYTIMEEPRFNDAGAVVVQTLQADRGIIAVPVSSLLIRPPKLVQR
jgi:hypothetical protein